MSHHVWRNFRIRTDENTKEMTVHRKENQVLETLPYIQMGKVGRNTHERCGSGADRGRSRPERECPRSKKERVKTCFKCC